MISAAIDPRRLAVIEEAEAWLGTPYHHMGRVKGVGTDCLMLLAEVYRKAGIIGQVEVPFYPPDWNLHRDAERYLDGVTAHACEIEGPPGPADVAVFRFGRCYAHGAIVVEWPRLIHAFVGVGVVRADATSGALAGRPAKFFSPFRRDSMMSHANRLRAAAFLLLLALSGGAPASAQSRSVEVPAYRQLGASETMSAPGNNGTDYSTHAPSLSGLSLLATIPAATAGSPRLGYFIEAQCAAGLTVVLDDQAGSVTPTIVVLVGATTDGGQGGSLDMAGMPHSGRIRIYSSSAACQMAARIW